MFSSSKVDLVLLKEDPLCQITEAREIECCNLSIEVPQRKAGIQASYVIQGEAKEAGRES